MPSISAEKTPHLYVAINDKVALRTVTVGAELERGAFVEILEGVHAGELVVIAGAEGLADGSKVRVHRSQSDGTPSIASASPHGSVAPAPSTRP